MTRFLTIRPWLLFTALLGPVLVCAVLLVALQPVGQLIPSVLVGFGLISYWGILLLWEWSLGNRLPGRETRRIWTVLFNVAIATVVLLVLAFLLGFWLPEFGRYSLQYTSAWLVVANGCYLYILGFVAVAVAGSDASVKPSIGEHRGVLLLAADTSDRRVVHPGPRVRDRRRARCRVTGANQPRGASWTDMKRRSVVGLISVAHAILLGLLCVALVATEPLVDAFLLAAVATMMVFGCVAMLIFLRAFQRTLVPGYPMSFIRGSRPDDMNERWAWYWGRASSLAMGAVLASSVLLWGIQRLIGTP